VEGQATASSSEGTEAPASGTGTQGIGEARRIAVCHTRVIIFRILKRITNYEQNAELSLTDSAGHSARLNRMARFGES
jgi:hypothetical protein